MQVAKLQKGRSKAGRQSIGHDRPVCGAAIRSTHVVHVAHIRCTTQSTLLTTSDAPFMNSVCIRDDSDRSKQCLQRYID